MSSFKAIPWTKFGLEGVLIVASILIAFWIDAWWADRQRGVEEQELLSQLKLEFESNAGLLAEQRSRHGDNRAAAERLLSVSGPANERGGFESETVREDLLKMLQWWTYDPQTGALLGTIQSGKLSIISSNELRTKLAFWPARLEDLAEDELFVAVFTRESIYPLFQTTISIRDVASALGVGPSSFSNDPSAILGKLEFENVVTQKLVMTEEILEIYDEFAGEISETLILLEQEL